MPPRPTDLRGSDVRLLPRFKNQVERRLGRPPEPGEARLPEYLLQPCFASLRPQCEANLLRQRVGRADHGGRGIVEPANRCRVLGQAVTRKGLNQKDRTVVLQGLSG